MSDLAIHVENLSKQYQIGVKQESYRTLRDTLSDGFKSFFSRNGKPSPVVSGPLSSVSGFQRSALGAQRLAPTDTYWALKNISFDIKRGQVIGFIGRNGAGKSTLLKILSRITEPTSGFADIYGRVGSLLEVGTGFHAELTGRENIYLNGAILGMKKTEIDRKFDEIVAFAEVEKFIETPVKHYSSGMYLRLAFAVAAHLEPEILIIDEVLAVGDANFQKKCLNKMEDVGKEGRTVLFVSHNMQAITRLCERVILLDEGGVGQDGPAQEVVSSYLRSELGTRAVREWDDSPKVPGNDIVRLRAARVRTEDGDISDVVDIRKPVAIEMEYRVLQSGHVLVPQFSLDNEEGIRVFVTFDSDPSWRCRARPKGDYLSTVWIPGNYLAEGTLTVRAGIFTLKPYKMHLLEPNVVAFRVVDTFDGHTARGDYAGHLPGVVRPLLKWNTRSESNNHDVLPMTTQETTTIG